MFQDRRDAGRRLAQQLLHLRQASNGSTPSLVLGLPRGGVVVAAEIARALEADLDVLIVRKLGAPHQAELAIGAVTDGANPRTVLNDDLIEAIGVSRSYLESEIAGQLDEVRRRQEHYRRGRSAQPIAGRTVIVVDDGIATGATVRAGLEALRESRPAHLVLAVPVAPPQSLRELSFQVDELVCLESPPNFTTVGRHYADFDQTTDEEVIALLDELNRR